MDERPMDSGKAITAETNSLSSDVPSGFAPLTLDVDLYKDYLDDPSMTQAEKRELIETLWSIMVSFVDLGFGIHPLQQAQSNCGPGDESKENLALASSRLLSSDPDTPENQISKTVDHADHDGAATRES